MSRTISATALQAVLAQQTDVIILTLVEIDHADLASPLRFVNNTENVTLSGNTYTAAAFDFRMPDDVEDNIPMAQISLDNVDRQIIEAVRPLNTAPDITVYVCLLDEGTMSCSIEIGPLSFKLKSFDYDADVIKGDLGYEENFLNEGYPKYSFNPRTSAGLF